MDCVFKNIFYRGFIRANLHDFNVDNMPVQQHYYTIGALAQSTLLSNENPTFNFEIN